MIPLVLKSLFFSLLIPGSVAVLIPLSITENELQAPWALYSGALMLTIGIVFYCWCVWDFVLFGKGTPAPINAPRCLVIKGLYHYTRNPMYISVLLIIFGWTLLFLDPSLLAYGFMVGICFQCFVVFYEEPRLKQLFTEQYLHYLTSVNRWAPGL